jgi:hypothetical protein
MQLTHHLALLTLRQLLAGTDDARRGEAAAALAGRCAAGDAVLLAALQRSQKLAWTALEIVVAGESFWDGCGVFLARPEHAAFRRQVDWLRQHTPLAGAQAPALRRRCAAELRANRPGQQPPDGAALAEALRAEAAGGDLAQTCPGVAEAFLHAGPDGTPALLPTALGYFARRELAAAPELAAGLPPLPPEQGAALARVGDVLAAHGLGLREWLAADSPPAECARPAGGPQHPQTAAAPTAADESQKPPDNTQSTRPRLGAWLLTLAVLLLPLLLMVWLIGRYTVEPAQRFEGHTEAVTGVTFLAGGAQVVSVGLDRTVRLWDAASGKELGHFKGETGGPARLAAATDGKRLLVAHAECVWLYDLPGRRPLKRFDLPKYTAAVAAFTPAGPRALTFGAASRKLQLWNLDTGKELHAFDLDQEPVHTLAMSADGRRAATGGKRVVLWDLEGRERLRAFEGPAATVTAVALTTDGGRVAAAVDDTLRIWDTATGEQLKLIKGPASTVVALALSADGKRLLSGASGTRGKPPSGDPRAADDPRPLRLWDVATGGDLALFSGPQGAVWDVAFAPDGKAALSGGDDKVVRLWKLQ